MKKVLFLTLTLLFTLQINAQQEPKEQTINLLRKQLDAIEMEEKNALKQQIENINSLQNNGVISAGEAERLKLKEAEAKARKIEERQAVILETIAYLEKKEVRQKKADKDNPVFFLDIDSYFDKSTKPQREPLKKQEPPKKENMPPEPSPVVPKTVQLPDMGEVKSPTTLDLVFAIGLNNAIGSGDWEELQDDRDYSLYGSRFLEIGLALKTPLVKENGLRLKYGLSYQSNGLKPNNNRFFAESDGQTQLKGDRRITASRFNVTNLVVPVHLEFGPTKKKQNAKGSYFSTGNQIKIGAGGYVGLNLSTRQRIEYLESHNEFQWVRAQVLNGYNINRLTYGLSAYAGIGSFSIYGKYDLNPIFKNGAKDEHFLSAGLRLDL